MREREEADLDALISRIQSDLRSGRSPGGPALHERRIRVMLREIRGRSLRRADVVHFAGRSLAPVAIFAVVLIAVLVFGKT